MDEQMPPHLLLDGKVVIVIGGLGLLGNDFVRGIASHGGQPVVADIKTKMENNHLAVDIDINSKESVLHLIDQVHKRYGRIDAIVNSAYPRNANYGKKFFEVTYEDFCGNVSSNIGGVFLVCQQIAEYFKRQGHGNIINIASIYGTVTPRFEIYKNTTMTMPVEYAAIKSAVIHLTKYLSKYLKDYNIRVNSLSPGGVLDKQPDDFISAYKAETNGKGLLRPHDVTNSLIYLISDLSSYVNGENLVVDDGFSL